MKIYLIISLFFTVLFSNCKNENIAPELPLPENTIRFVADGQEYESSSTFAEIYCETFNGSKINYSINFHALFLNPSYQFNNILFILSDISEPFTEKEYETADAQFDGKEDVSCFLGDTDTSPNTEYTNDLLNTTAKLNFTVLEFEKEGLLKGTFSASLMDKQTNNIIEITEGEFHLRIED